MKLIRRIGLSTLGKLKTRKQKVSPNKLSWLNEKILKHQDDKLVKLFSTSNFHIYYIRPYELLHTYKEIFERGIYKFKADSETPLILDCGSNIGLSVLYFKSLFPNSHIIAFEPDEENFKLLKRNTESNQLTKVQLNKKAIWMENGTISFSAAGSEASRISNNSDSNKVESLRLQTLLNNYPIVDFLKLDIEGAEFEVLNDCVSSLNRVKNMFLEYHGKVNETYKLDSIFSILKSSGFKVYIENATSPLVSPFYEKSSESAYDVQLNIFCYK